jgi:hypothetical protein
MWSPHGLGVRREDESAVGAGRRRRSKAMWGGGGKVQLKCGDGRKLLTWLLWGAPLSEGRALIAYLIGRGLKPLWEVW